ncbi:sugar kinase [Paenochrobactrum glaciei]|uniref:Sugar kinase n=1 Tax=Paenochrobactrum glaciei TaxID=486407 RepID=A0ABN1G2I5_9HYPH
MHGFASVGECMIELSGQNDTQWHMGFAGDTLNTAWYVRALTQPDFAVDYITAFGDDAFSNQQMAFLNENGIATNKSPIIKGARPGLYAITLTGAERSFTYWRNDSAARRLAENPAHLLESLKTRKMIYFSGITLAIILPEHRQSFLEVIKQCRAEGAQIAFDPNFRPALWPDHNLARELITQAMRSSDIALPTLPDEQALFGDADGQACAARLTGLGVKEIIVKDGTDPAIVQFEGKQVLVPSVKANAIDTTGAGDSFNGGYLAARLKGATAEEAAAQAHQVAARVVECRGALMPMQTAHDLFMR